MLPLIRHQQPKIQHPNLVVAVVAAAADHLTEAVWAVEDEAVQAEEALAVQEEWVAAEVVSEDVVVLEEWDVEGP